MKLTPEVLGLKEKLMLNDLLRLLGDGGIHSTAELARRLGVGEALLNTMTSDLTRRGYLAALDTSCATACDGCGLSASCAAPGEPTPNNTRAPLLMLTAKGRGSI
jgi:hypothetical protein